MTIAIEPDELLERSIDHIKDSFDEHDLSIDELHQREQEGEGREELIEWFKEKKERLELLESEEHLDDMLSHIEWAYRTASISKTTYDRAREITNRLKENA